MSADQNNAPPDLIPGYRLIECVSRGGMGAVYRALQLSMDRTVAVKILARKYTDDPVFVERFLKEARAAARLSHPNIVQAIDVGEANGTYYFVMEFVEGSSLSELLRQRGRLPPLEACTIVMQIARALEYAAHHGTLHLDVKPANILITGTGLAKLADFGLARHVEDEDTLRTRKRVIFGTPPYMSPEQLSGATDLDCRSDIYSLGVTFRELVTGENPFKADETREVLRKVRAGNVPPAHTTDDSVPLDVSLVIAKMMATNRDERYANPAALLVDLDALSRLRTPPIASGLLPAPAQSQEPTRVWPKVIVGAALLVLLSALGAALLVARYGREILELRRGERARTAVEAPPPPMVEIPSEDDVTASALELELKRTDAEANKLMAAGEFDEALRLYTDYASRAAGSRWSEVAMAQAENVRIRARWAAQELMDEMERAIERNDLRAADAICRRIEAMGLPETQAVARIGRTRLQQAENRQRMLAAERQRREARRAFLVLEKAAQDALRTGVLESAEDSCQTFLANQNYAEMHAAARDIAERLQLVRDLRDAVLVGAQLASAYSLQGSPEGARVLGSRDGEIVVRIGTEDRSLAFTDLAPEDIVALATIGGAGPLTVHGGLAAILDARGLPTAVCTEMRALRQTGIADLPESLVSLERNSIPPAISALLDQSKPRQAYELFQYLKRQYGNTDFYRSRRTELRAVLGRIQTALAGGMQPVPAGLFIYGKRRPEPERKYLGLFYIDVHEVTNAEYEKFLEFLSRTGSKEFDHPAQPPSKTDHVPLDWETLSKNRPNYPVVGVDWFDAYAYARWRGKRLPTESEWEKAARGQDGRRYPWGSSWDDAACNALPQVFMSGEERPSDVKPVGSFPKGLSPYGIADMAGNAREWVADDDEPQGVLPDLAPVRGGSFKDTAIACAATATLKLPRLYRGPETGFRCALDPLDLEP